MRIAFFAESCLPIHAKTLSERPLGGTETALIRLAEILQTRGHDVTVFTSHKSPPPSQPRYLHAPAVHAEGMFDVFVCVKDYKPAVSGAPGKRIFYWTGDGFDQYINFGFGDPRVAKKVDYFLAVSEWHKQSLCEASGFPLDKTAVIYNGVHLPYFAGTEQRSRRRLIFTSAPYRGLNLVPPIYKKLKERYSDLELHVYSGMSLYDTDQPFRGPQVAQFEQIKKVLLTMPGCFVHGNITQARLARELMKSSILIYPNTIFETFCIVALEGLAAGCPVIASNNSALPETIGNAGVVIDGTPGEAEYNQNFIAAADKLLSDDAYWQQLSDAGIQKVQQGYTWDHVADRFEALL